MPRRKTHLRIGASDDEQVKPTAIAPDREAYVCADHVAFHYHVIGARFLSRLSKPTQLPVRPPRAPKGHHVEELEEMKKYLEQCEVSKREQEKILFVE
ncbi:hypothetical protein KIN20_013236 [Parelaphostrongylus tenuis]|uniref:Uncharacterized protein n=1 Tax=Parelaphostrongylus tenuis TaxID=148309 RepID=A0AAD5MBU2_PARTN|nr:hypothetical protein KIN20_013236 [Parelaphostrongylus tenuis]